ncbi:MAG: glycoside hydrolase family 15 protein [Candidatus Nanopelagicaceae bacterium]|nr:glycoside hydrolase family 15 protein [Candidatus Nanopelagicaceae bacterium]
MFQKYLDPSSLNDGGLGVRSVQVLLDGQSPSGAFVASPNFASYRFSWLRDGAYCANAMDLVGNTESATKFHLWVENTLSRQIPTAELLIGRLNNGETPAMSEMLPTRYTLDGVLERFGEVENVAWPNYQLDGYGVWLDELRRHHQILGTTDFNREVVDLVARYLVAAWKTDCYDCWEELGDGQHASTIAAVAAGLESAGHLLNEDKYLREAQEVRDTLFRKFVRNGRFCKGLSDDRVDSSLLWLALPFRVVELDDPAFVKTVEEIRSSLRGTTGGTYRYLGDTYFGGGEWFLLTSWLGWYDRLANNPSEFEHSRKWVIEKATQNLELPEQSSAGTQEPTMIDPWVRRWGSVATPLLWSHAMYLIMSEGER